MKELRNLKGLNMISKSDQKAIHGGLDDLPDCSHYNCVVEVNPITGLCFCAED